MTPGEIVTAPGTIALRAGRERVIVVVTNTGDRPIQVGSHAHFADVNAALTFDRAAARGMCLDIPAGTAVRFEPGEVKTVTLVSIAGARIIRGGNAWARTATMTAATPPIARFRITLGASSP